MFTVGNPLCEVPTTCFPTQGLRFTHFPQLLTFQLKRFDLDYTTLQRIKLNDKMTFPRVLNLNRFLVRRFVG